MIRLTLIPTSEAARYRLAKTILDYVKAGQGIVVRRVGGSIIIDVNPSTINPMLANTSVKGTTNEDNYADFTYTGKHTEQVMDDDGWDREKQINTGKYGFKITLQMGEAYYDTGDQKLYAYVRDFTFDNLGMAKEASEERRVLIDSPEDCT